MAKAFNASFTALYVETRNTDKMDEADRNRLDYHMKLAKQLGADINTIYGDDVSYQIAEYARISGVTKIVIGRSNIKKRHMFGKQSLTEKLTLITPHIDIHIMNYRETKDGHAIIAATISVNGKEHLEAIIAKLSRINGVINISRSGS